MKGDAVRGFGAADVQNLTIVQAGEPSEREPAPLFSSTPDGVPGALLMFSE